MGKLQLSLFHFFRQLSNRSAHVSNPLERRLIWIIGLYLAAQSDVPASKRVNREVYEAWCVLYRLAAKHNLMNDLLADEDLKTRLTFFLRQNPVPHSSLRDLE